MAITEKLSLKRLFELIGNLSNLVTVNKDDLVSAINEAATMGKSYITTEEEFTTVAGQTMFNLQNMYTMGQNQVEVKINGLCQPPSLFDEINEKSIRFKVPISAKQHVVIRYTHISNVLNGDDPSLPPVDSITRINIQEVKTCYTESFVTTKNQTIFNLQQGTYTLGKNQIDFYINGAHQRPDLFIEVDEHTIQTVIPVPEGQLVHIKYTLLNEINEDFNIDMAEVAAIKEAVVDHENRLDNLDVVVPELGNTVVNLGNNVTSIEQNLETATEDITNLNNSVTTIEQNYNSLNSVVQDHTEQIESILANPPSSGGPEPGTYFRRMVITQEELDTIGIDNLEEDVIYIVQ